jgi:hypothetical protein
MVNNRVFSEVIGVVAQDFLIDELAESHRYTRAAVS